MALVPFPGPGQDGGEQPPPGDDGWDGDAELARFLTEVDAGRIPVPGEDELLRRLNVTFAPIAKGECDHRHREDRYTPSRMLKHLLWARTTRCTAPGCDAQAIYCDLDHTRPYPAGITCECELSPACRRHHRCKQAPGWHLEQPEAGVMRWTTPSGRTYTTRPTQYDL